MSPRYTTSTTRPLSTPVTELTASATTEATAESMRGRLRNKRLRRVNATFLRLQHKINTCRLRARTPSSGHRQTTGSLQSRRQSARVNSADVTRFRRVKLVLLTTLPQIGEERGSRAKVIRDPRRLTNTSTNCLRWN